MLMDNPVSPLPQYGQDPNQQYQNQQYPQQYQQPYQAPQPAPSVAQYSPQAQNPGQYGIQTVDSLTANEFRLEINGQAAAGIFAVHGLSSFNLRLDENNKPTAFNYPPLVVTKMVQQDRNIPFN